jgi:hypothetical protein
MSWKRFIFGTDLHGDKQHNPTVDIFLEFCGQWKPHIKIFGGDLFDFRPLRRGANEDEKHESMKEDFQAGMRFLECFQPDFLLRGNHCERLWELGINGKGVMGDYAVRAISEIEDLVRTLKCTMLPYHKRDGVLQIGHAKFLHGFNSGVYAARTTAQVYGSVHMGHTHVIEEYAIPGLERRCARVCGCLCELDMHYNARQPSTLRQAHGFAYGVINDKTGDYFTLQAEEVNGNWCLPTEMKPWAAAEKQLV